MLSELYCEVKGEGQDVVLLHGWGMHGGFWGDFKTILSESYCLHVVDLPGYGFSNSYMGDIDLDAMTEIVEKFIKKINKPVVLVGWSLGGLITLNILKRKNREIKKVVFIASTPCFTIKSGLTGKAEQENAMNQTVFDEFSENLKNNSRKTLQRFLFLQTYGCEIRRDGLRQLKSKLNERGEPAINGLKSGLKILNETDLRNVDLKKPDLRKSELKNSYSGDEILTDVIKHTIPAMVILGEDDALVPVSVINEFKKLFTHLEQLLLHKTGHMPFISEPAICAEKIKKFIDE